VAVDMISPISPSSLVIDRIGAIEERDPGVLAKPIIRRESARQWVGQNMTPAPDRLNCQDVHFREDLEDPKPERSFSVRDIHACSIVKKTEITPTNCLSEGNRHCVRPRLPVVEILRSPGNVLVMSER
jgi:hypothetical protein